MPADGIELSPSENILTNEEVLRLAKLFVQSGVTKIRLTGGEPTVRKGILEVIGAYICPLNDSRIMLVGVVGVFSDDFPSSCDALHRWTQ